MPHQPSIYRSGFSSKSLILGGVMWTAVFVCLFFVWKSRQHEDGIASAAQPVSADEEGESQQSVKIGFPARELPDFEFEECNGGTVSLADLKGKPWVASFIFTQCASTCPTISASMMRLQKRVIDRNKDVMLVTITVNPKYDTPEILKTYSETFQPNRDRWKFLTGSQQEIYELVVNGFGLYVKENVGEMKMPGFEVAHSNRVVLVNEAGIPVGTFLGTRDEDMAKLGGILNGRDEFPEPGPSLSFSSTDGTPLNIQFDVQPVEDSTTDSEDQAGEEDASSESGEPETGASAAENDKVENTEPVNALQHNQAIDSRMPAWSRKLPAINAALNSVAAFFLLIAYRAIRRGKKTLHRNLMISAFLTSVAFLACYLTYHYLLGQYTDTHGKKFPGDGIWKVVYFAILIPHVILAAAVPFMAIRVFQHAFAERWDAHRKLARVTFPIWMFVSVTGVMIYGMLYHWPSNSVPAV